MIRFAFFILCTAVTHSVIVGQSTISGKVTDGETGNGLAGVNIRIEGSTLGASSRAGGRFEIRNVPAGKYKITATHIGYESMTVDVLVNDEDVTVDFALNEGSIAGEELVFTASRKVEKITDAPATINVVNSQSVDQYTGNPGELLARTKGVDYIRSGVLGTGINVRGFNSAFNPKNLQMNDTRLSTLIATGLPMGPLATTVKEDIERMEVVLGPAAALYGPNAHNGLVNTISKDPRQFPGTTFVIGGGSQSVQTGRFRTAHVLNDKVAFKATGEFTRGTDIKYMDSVYISGVAYPELELDRDFDALRGEASAYYTILPDHDMIVTFGGSNSNYLSVTNAGRNQIKDWQIYFLQGRYVSPHLFAQLYHTWSKTDKTYAINQRTQNYQNLLLNGYTEQGARDSSFSYQKAGAFVLPRGAIFKDNSARWNAEVQYNNTLNQLHYIVGAQYQKDIADSKGTYLLDAPGIYLEQFGGYAQLEHPIAETGMRVIVAARGDHHELYGFNFIPKAALTYSNPVGTFRVTYGKGIAAPTILNLNGNLFGGLILGNGEGFTRGDGSKVKKLEVETIQTFEVGYKGVFHQKLFVDVNGYYNMSENFISPLVNIASASNPITHRGGTPMSQVVPGTPASGSTFLLTYLNYGEVNTFGADIGLNYYVSKDINVTLNYSFFDFDFDKKDTLRNDGNKDNRIDQADISLNAPKHKIGLGVNARRDKFFGSLFLRWVDEYDFFSGINVASKEHSSVTYGGSPVLEDARVGRDFNEGPLGGFVNIDLSLGYHITQQLTISATVVNLFDSEVREFVASPAIGRLISTELKYTF